MEFKLLSTELLEEVNTMIKESKIPVSEDYDEMYRKDQDEFSDAEISDEDAEMEAEEEMDRKIKKIGYEFGKLDKDSLSNDEFVEKAKEILSKYDYPFNPKYGYEEFSELYDMIALNVDETLDESANIEVSIHDIDSSNLDDVIAYLVDNWNMNPDNLLGLAEENVLEIFNTIKKLTSPKSVEESMDDYLDIKTDVNNAIDALVHIFGMDKEELMKKTDDEVLSMFKVKNDLIK